MPLYSFQCECGVKGMERVRPIYAANPPCPSCQKPMVKEATVPALIHIKGQGLPARKKWMDNWTPGTPPLSTGSLHGERY